MLLNDPVTLYKEGKSRRIPAIDAPGWIRAGWRASDEFTPPAPHYPLSPEGAPPSPIPIPLSPPPDLMENSSSFLEEIAEVTPKRRGSKNGGNTVSEN
ncbi:hypothetical protein [Nostoc sp.]|uniref:hypothetical protein n=1 Tax=Nostoc sp. TaxID=1180 RepID=UPI002FEFD833